MLVQAPISIGELYDKITILRIKAKRLTDPRQQANVRDELHKLERVARAVPSVATLGELVEQLLAINEGLWDVEDAKRAHEREGRFDADFIALARRVYLENDRRAQIKRRINQLTQSAIIEEKSHG